MNFGILNHGEIGQNMPQSQTCAMMKTCVMTSHVHFERGSVISDCLVSIGPITRSIIVVHFCSTI